MSKSTEQLLSERRELHQQIADLERRGQSAAWRASFGHFETYLASKRQQLAKLDCALNDTDGWEYPLLSPRLTA